MIAHPTANYFPLLGAADLARLASDIKTNGLLHPLVVQGGLILDGRNRWLACEQAGVEPRTVEYTGTDPLAYVISANLERRHLNESQRAMVAARLANIPKHRHKVNGDSSIELSQTDAAERMNVSVASLKRAKALLKNNPERVAAIEAGLSSLGQPTRLTLNSGDSEWYTPVEFITAARAVLREIDLDPASTIEANMVVGAEKFFTREQDGLTREWKGRVWLNPPYASDLIGKFIEKLKASFTSGAVPEALALVNNGTETVWFQSICEVVSAICFPKSRVRFWSPDPDRNLTSPLQGQAFLYLGKGWARFCEEFRHVGCVFVTPGAR